tara:strand:- start:1633 stop:1983 length:351 start_codon:yes stop_codon:yes gene_type:complete
MSDTVIFVFTQENCPPCYRLKSYIKTLPSEQRDAIELVPFKTPTGQKTALAEELNIDVTPTLVVASEYLVCNTDTDDDGFRFCDLKDEAIETIVGGQNITTALPGVIKNYATTTYV